MSVDNTDKHHTDFGIYKTAGQTTGRQINECDSKKL